MTISSEVFYIGKGGSGIDSVNNFILQTLEYNAYLIKNVSASSLNEKVTALTVTYEKYDSEMVHDISPKENYILTTGINSADYGINILFSHQVSTDIRSGAVMVDGTGLYAGGTGTVNGSGIFVSQSGIDSYSNSYVISVGLSGFTATGSHFYLIDNTKISRADGSTFSNPVAGGYVFHTQSSASQGFKYSINKSKIRGKVTVDVVYLNKSNQLQQYISQYLSDRNVSQDFLISYSLISKTSDQIELYIAYVSEPEPQIITGYPFNHSLIPVNKKPKTVSLTFSTDIVASQLTSQLDLIGIISGSGPSTSISPQHISILSDNRTAIINIESYLTSSKIYTLVVRPGIISSKRFIKQKPDFWTIVVDTYEGSSGTGDANMNDVMRRISFRGMGA